MWGRCRDRYGGRCGRAYVVNVEGVEKCVGVGGGKERCEKGVGRGGKRCGGR